MISERFFFRFILGEYIGLYSGRRRDGGKCSIKYLCIFEKELLLYFWVKFFGEYKRYIIYINILFIMYINVFYIYEINW